MTTTPTKSPASPAPVRKQSFELGCRQNFHEECENLLNREIKFELYASYVYESMANYFQRDNVALPGLGRYFQARSDRQRVNAERLMTYQNLRGGQLAYRDIVKPVESEWGSALRAMEAALELEKRVNQSLLDLWKTASKHNDANLMYFIRREFLDEQIQVIKSVSSKITNLKRLGPGFGEFVFDAYV